MVSYPHVFQVGDETYMAYLGNGVGRRRFNFKAPLKGELE